MTSKVNFKKRAQSKKEVFVFLFFILSFGLTVGFMTTLRPSQAEKKVDTENQTLAQTTQVDSTATLSDFPTGTPSVSSEPIAVTPTTSVTPTTQPVQIQEQVEKTFDEIATAVSYYSGPPLPAPSEKKELLIISDSLPQEPWKVEKEDFEWVPGKLGRGIKPGQQGLLLSQGEFFVASGSMSFWLYVEGATNGLEAPILDWNYNGVGRTPFLFEVLLVDDTLYFITHNQDVDQDEIHAKLTLNNWHQILVSWDLSSNPYHRTLYIDGQKVATSPFPFAPVEVRPSFFQIGGKTEINNTFVPFVIDEIIWRNWANLE